MHVYAIFLVVVGSCLKVSSSRGSYLKDTIWAISSRVLTLSGPFWLMTIGMILSSALRVPWV